MPPRLDNNSLRSFRRASRPREPVAKSLERTARKTFAAHPTVAAGVLLEFRAGHAAVGENPWAHLNLPGACVSWLRLERLARPGSFALQSLCHGARDGHRRTIV
eukprot:4997155-Pyramimonas_sp.AAC.1